MCVYVLFGDDRAVNAPDNLHVFVRHYDAFLDWREFDADLDHVELKRDQRQCVRIVLGEPELKRHVQSPWLARKFDAFGHSVKVTGHLPEAFSRRRRQLFPNVHELTVLNVDDLTADADIRALD